ncbi:hypothetical protein [Xanthomonas melonis]|uniref:hypothetical protein n=1 Tax=Xanthomonas melonis TaxID=56456 RepID=UPI003EBA4E0E
MFMVEPAAPEPRRTAPQWPPPTAPWPADSPLDPAVARFAGAARYQVWRRGQAWTAVADGVHWWAVLAPRAWAMHHRHWPLLWAALPPVTGAAGVALAGAQAWTPAAWLLLLVVECALRVHAGRHAGRWRSAALQRDGWQPVTLLRAISVTDAVTTAQIRTGRPPH